MKSRKKRGRKHKILKNIHLILIALLIFVLLIFLSVIFIKISRYGEGKGLYTISIWTKGYVDEDNLIKNPKFDYGLNDWILYGGGIKEVRDVNGDNKLYIENNDTGNIGIYQSFDFNESKTNPFFVSYKINLTNFSNAAFVSLNMYVLYDNDSYSYNLGPFYVHNDDLFIEREKTFIFIPNRPVKKISIFLINYYNYSSAYYDDIVLHEITPDDEIVLENNSVKLILYKYGHVKSLLYNGEEKLKKSSSLNPLSKLYFNDSSIKYSNSIASLGNNQYRIGYYGTETEVIMNITIHQDYLKFSIFNITNLDERINYISLFSLPTEHIPDLEKDWAVNSSENEIFSSALPLNVNVICYDWLNECRIFNKSGFIGNPAVFMLTPKINYFDKIEDIINENNILATYTDDGKWLRNTKEFRDSYLFAYIDKNNYREFLELAKKGKFRQFLALGPLYFGDFTHVTGFNSIDDFYLAADEFIRNKIKFGIHNMMNEMQTNDKYLINLSNPDILLKDNFYNENIGKLTGSIDEYVTEIILDNNLGNNRVFQYREEFERNYKPAMATRFIIDNEIILCRNYSGNKLLNCSRGFDGTIAKSHNINGEIGIMPEGDYGIALFITPYSELHNRSIAAFKKTADRINLSYLYVDGYSFSPDIDFDWNFKINLMQKYGVVEYIKGLNKIPYIQFAASGSKMQWFYGGKVASGDGVVFKNKEFTKNFKLNKAIITNNPYSRIIYEMGWWKIHGSNLGSGVYDYDSTTYDDIDYAMTKVIVYDTSLGLQFSSYYSLNKRVNSSLELIGKYNDLMYKDIDEKIIPKTARDYLKQPDNEAKISNVSGYNLIEKEVFKNYAIWNSSVNYTYQINNPFKKQKLKIEIRPKFDYYGFNDIRNILIFNFSNDLLNDKITITKSSANITCFNDKGTINIYNSGNSLGGCKLRIIKDFSLTNKRGIGISLIGDNKNELVTIAFGKSYAYAYGERAYDFAINFSGEKEIIMGDAITNEQIIDGNTIFWDTGKFFGRSWDYDFSNSNYIDVYIDNIKPGESYSIKLKEIKGLEEKRSNLVNVSISIGNQKLIFPVKLNLSEKSSSILEYDGSRGIYELYSYNYDFISSGNASPIFLNPGTNEIIVSSDTSSPEHISRADIRISVYDDEDDDLVPSDGNYDASYMPCNGDNDFCDDNCPDVYNPAQTDSDNDGVGDLCDNDMPVNLQNGETSSNGYADNRNRNYSLNDSNNTNQNLTPYNTDNLREQPGNESNIEMPLERRYNNFIYLSIILFIIISIIVITLIFLRLRKNKIPDSEYSIRDADVDNTTLFNSESIEK